MLAVSATEEWKRVHRGAVIGLLELSGIDNRKSCDGLEQRKRTTEAALRSQYAGSTRRELRSHPVLAAYADYYRRFNKTYHVQLQLESIVLKGKSLPIVSPAVDANFMAEVETFVLAAGHDVARLAEPVVMDVSREGDRIVQMSGDPKDLRPGDMIMRDAEGVSCSVIYGQDARSPISAHTSHVLYVVYAPAGVPGGQAEHALSRVEELVRVCSPDAVREQRRLLRAAPIVS